jgi:hypothetical protein
MLQGIATEQYMRTAAARVGTIAYENMQNGHSGRTAAAAILAG